MKRILSVFLILGMFVIGLLPASVSAAEQYQVPAGFPKSFISPIDETRNVPVGGFGGGSGAITHNPVVFVHGNTRNANDWLPVYKYFLSKGYTANELWSLSWGNNSLQNIDANDENIGDIRNFVEEVLRYTRMVNRNINKVDIISHSLGPTIVRKAIKIYGLEDKIGTHVMIAGANHGMELCAPGINVVCDELYPNSPWLQDLNNPMENPQPIKHVTIYDGTGKYDKAFLGDRIKDSPAINGGINYPINILQKLTLNHDELRVHPASMELQYQSVKDNLVEESK